MAKAAQQAANQAGSVAGGYGANANSIAANLLPQLTRQMNNPTGMSQRDVGAQLTAGLAGAGGSAAGLTGAAEKAAIGGRNPMGFGAALDAAARSRDKAAAGMSEGVASENAKVKLQQQAVAQGALGGLYGTSASAQNEAMKTQAEDIREADANSGLNQAMRAVGTLSQGAGSIMGGL